MNQPKSYRWKVSTFARSLKIEIWNLPKSLTSAAHLLCIDKAMLNSRYLLWCAETFQLSHRRGKNKTYISGFPIHSAKHHTTPHHIAVLVLVLTKSIHKITCSPEVYLLSIKGSICKQTCHSLAILWFGCGSLPRLIWWKLEPMHDGVDMMGPGGR
jgi:hypothetical protein